MRWKIFEFLDHRGQGVIEVWLKRARIQKEGRQRLNLKLALLTQAGPDLPPGLLAGPIDGGHIYKLRVKAPRVQLRPLLCRGPIDNDSEFTLLLGATERDWELVPEDAPQRAEDNRQIIIAAPKRRRLHEQNF
jgi:hypothetical protein